MSSSFLRPFAEVGRSTDDTVNIVSGTGARVRDDRGREYIDAMAGLWFQNIGYGRREMAESIASACQRLGAFHAFDKYTNPAAEQLADRIVGLSPMEHARVSLTSSGSEAVESAVKLARLAHSLNGAPERSIIISRRRGYHGVALAGTSASGLPVNTEGFGPLAGDFVVVESDSLDDMRSVCEEHPHRIAAILTEPVQGAGGVHPPTPGYLAELRELADEVGAFLIFDEVISGFGRLGSWFAAQHFGVTPDILTFAKAVTSGYVPLGGVVVGAAVLEPICRDPRFVLRHGHTYAGHQVAASAALTNLDIIESEALLSRAAKIGAALATAFQDLPAKGLAEEVRSIGAVCAIQLAQPLDAVKMRDRIEEQGVITRPSFGAICICPPLVITDEDLSTVTNVVSSTLQDACS